MTRTALLNFRLLRWLLVVAALASGLAAADADALFNAGLAAEARFDSRGALEFFQQADAARPNDAAILQKISRQYSDSSADASDATEKKRLLNEALAYAKRAVAVNPKSAVNVLSLAICYGKLGLLSETRTRVEYSRHVKEFADQAVALDPNYAFAHHLLGRWNYEVASLGLAARLAVRLVYGGLPPASTAEAVRQLQRAVELSPQSPAHRVELGFALLADGQRDDARETFTHALAMPPVEKYDLESLARAREALAKLPGA